ncbi:hypothetical protein VFPPC_09365 [Pochonia chlamydosporia 170]|uniref:Uncharacterized protein n=1 Tax=Pochonia chlamydosporia 170 TaxID=1380566 RepID=A0A179F8W1_METCM|nr:hypothetical protein VFPPC_09365 [Pochonia chlamydosporia 170]OAQ61539.2 hypothetical protein VFPPC_09365 [Pochonia chlamydosporia 170]
MDVPEPALAGLAETGGAAQANYKNTTCFLEGWNGTISKRWSLNEAWAWSTDSVSGERIKSPCSID